MTSTARSFTHADRTLVEMAETLAKDELGAPKEQVILEKWG